MRRTLVCVAALVMLAGCSQSGYGTSHGIKDAGHDGGDNLPAHIINMPDGFMNLAFKCNGGDGIYAHTRDAAPVIVPNDANCPAEAHR